MARAATSSVDRAGNVTTSGTAINSSSLSSSVSSILNLQAEADAATIKAKGAAAEANAYGVQEFTAGQESILTGVAGQIQQLQAARKTAGTIGAQKAQVSAGGFAESGSNLDILASSVQQGYLTQQLIQSQTALTQMGYLGEKAAAGASKTAATDLSTTYTDLTTKYSTAATDETTALNKLLKGTTLTASEKLILQPLSGNTGVDALLDTPTGGRGSDPVESGITKVKGEYYRVGDDGTILPNTLKDVPLSTISAKT